MITKRHARTAALTIAAAAALTFAGAGAAQAAPAIPLTGGQEAPKPNNFGAHGSFSYEIDDDLNEFCYTLDVTGLSAPATAAHVHVAPRNVPGPVVVPLVVPNETDFSVSGCTIVNNEALLDDIAANPGAYYVNVHNANNMPGEIRGQLK
ncbi:CHRD domain-containing protein [Agromyces mariniharenae]|uniref:CHRD domain-containing protein n=1 Tax=Agromyces mariniharenae TaxID=2604423 RepID=A0A5S4V252_9MICO|nr:CHRD domain-containing protein [Agromyces mariniharenae]TYL52308.1 CHRD domain-containing protein [Agromyces mariniharenae]